MLPTILGLIVRDDSALIDSLLERASCLASIDLQRSGFVPSLEERSELLKASEKLRLALSRPGSKRRLPPDLRQRAAAQVDLIHSIISPIRRLPPELLSRIFIAYLWSCPGANLISLKICRVCSEWREIALGTPQLWTYISDDRFERPLIHGLDYSGQAALTGDLPLHLRFSLEHTKKLCTQLRPHSARWQTIDVFACEISLESLHAMTFPAMQSATISLQGAITSRSFQFLNSAPVLSNLSIILLMIDQNESMWSSFNLPTLPHLTSFEIMIIFGVDRAPKPPIASLLSAVRALATSLTSLDLYTETEFSGTEVFGNRSLLLCSLRELSLGGDAVRILLKYIVAPGLHSLAILTLARSGPRAPAECPFLDILDFLSFRLPHLKHLRIDDSFGVSDGTTAPFVSCLQLLGDLEELEVTESEGCVPYFLEQRTLNLLTCTHNAQPLLPKLSKLVVVVDHRETIQPVERALHGMLQSRGTARTCASQVVELKHVELDIGRYDYDDRYKGSVILTRSMY